MRPGKSSGSMFRHNSHTDLARFAGRFGHPTRRTMKHAMTWIGSRLALALLAAAYLIAPNSAVLGSAHPEAPGPVGFIIHTNYHGWSNSILVSNGRVEAMIVPAIGRVMQFRFAGEEDGPFWENRVLDGRKPEPESKEWGNFGGDKTWPAPQADWWRITP